MTPEGLEKLYKERRLLKELLSLDRERYSHLDHRIQELKTIINSEFAAIPNSQVQFSIFDLELSNRIQNFGKNYLKESLKKS